MAENTIDLGKTYDPSADMVKKDSKPKPVYPTVTITHDMKGKGSELNDMANEGDAIIHYKISNYHEDLKNKTCSCTLEIMSITPSESADEEAAETDDDADEGGLDGALTKIASKKASKADDAEDVKDGGADEDTEET